MSEQTTVLSSEVWVNNAKKIKVTKKTRRSTSTFHMHDYFEIELIVDGHGTQNLNGVPYELQRGTVYFVSPIDFHTVVPQKKLELINISFDNNAVSTQLLNTLINGARNHIMQLDEQELREFENILSMILRDASVEDAYSETLTKNLLECLLILLIRKSDILSEAIKNGAGDDISPLYKCMRHLFLHFSETPSLEEMARMSGYSANYFSKQFHEVTGKKYIDFLTSLKVNHAKLLLTSTTDSVISIYANCGFTSLSNFNRVFKKETGLSPTQYRKEHTSSV